MICFFWGGLINQLITFDFCWRHNISDTSVAAVVDGNILKLTPFSSMLVPPPMAALEIPFPHTINQFSWAPSIFGDSYSIATCVCSNGSLFVIKTDGLSREVSNIAQINAEQLLEQGIDMRDTRHILCLSARHILLMLPNHNHSDTLQTDELVDIVLQSQSHESEANHLNIEQIVRLPLEDQVFCATYGSAIDQSAVIQLKSSSLLYYYYSEKRIEPMEFDLVEPCPSMTFADTLQGPRIFALSKVRTQNIDRIHLKKKKKTLLESRLVVCGHTCVSSVLIDTNFIYSVFTP